MAILGDILGDIEAANILLGQADDLKTVSVYPDELLLLGNWNNVVRQPSTSGDVISVILGKGRLKGDASSDSTIYFGSPEMYPTILRQPEASPYVNLSAKETEDGGSSVLCLGFEILLKKIESGLYQGTGAFTLAYNFDAYVTPEYNRSIFDFNPMLNTNPVYLSARIFRDGAGGDHTLEIAVKSYDKEKASDVETIVVFSYDYNVSTSSLFSRPISEGGIFGTLETVDPNRSRLFDNSIVSDVQIIPMARVDEVWVDRGLGITSSPIWGVERRNAYFEEFAFSYPYNIGDIVFFDVNRTGYDRDTRVTATSVFTSDPKVVRFYIKSDVERDGGLLEPSNEVVEKEERIDITVLWQLSWMPSYENVGYDIFNKNGDKIGRGTGNRFVVKFPNDHSLPPSVDKLLKPLNAYHDAQILWTYKTNKLNRSSDSVLSNTIFDVKGVFTLPTEVTKYSTDFNITYSDRIKTMFFEVENALKRVWPKHVIDNIELKQDEGLYTPTGIERTPPPIEDYSSFGTDVTPKTLIRMILFNIFNNIGSTFAYAFWQPSNAQIRSLSTGNSLEYKYLEVVGAYLFDRSNIVNKERAIDSASNLLSTGEEIQTIEIKGLITGASSSKAWDLPQVLFGKFEPGNKDSGIDYIEPWSERYKAYKFNTGVDFIFDVGEVSELFSAVPNQEV